MLQDASSTNALWPRYELFRASQALCPVRVAQGDGKTNAKPPTIDRSEIMESWTILRCRTRKVETDDLNRRASAMSIELVRRRSSINYDNLPVNRV